MANYYFPTKTYYALSDLLFTYEDDHRCEYPYAAVTKLSDYMEQHFHNFVLDCEDWPNEEGGACAISFVENNSPQLFMFSYYY